MPIEYRYETNCCGEESVHTSPTLRAGNDERVWCDEHNWMTTDHCVEQIIVDERGDVL